MLQGARRRVYGGVFAFVFGVVAMWMGGFLFQSVIPHALALNDIPPGEEDWTSQYEYINLDTVWHKSDTLTFDKPVFIDNNATLTIEAGAQVRLNGGAMDVMWGNIIASGTESEPIVFTSDNNTPFTITFVDYEEGIDGTVGKASLLQYVDITSGGSYTDPDECGTTSYFRSLLIDTALAAGECAWGMPAVVYMSGRVTFEHVDFIGNRYADIWVNGQFVEYNRTDFFHVSNSNFGDNAQSTAVVSRGYCSTEFPAEECRQKVVMRNNWWGDASGPNFQASAFEASNADASGDRIEGDGVLLFRPFAQAPFVRMQPVGCIEDCFSNVLFLPGVEASRLYAKDDPDCTFVNCENQLWEPNRNEDVKKLYLDSNGKSTDAYDIYTRDVLDEVNISGSNIYESFIDTMDSLKNDDHLINDWQAVPYDWRLSLEDIVNGGVVSGENISYNGESIAPHIIGELKRLASSSRTGKVTIVTHSNGGLVAKALMQKIGDVETQKLIDEVVMVGVPQLGTPVAVGAMLHGYDQDLLGGLILSKSTARGLAEHMSSAYTLLPSDKYFDTVGTPVVTFDSEKLPEWSGKYGDVINSQEGMHNFLTDVYERVDAISSDTEKPSKLDNDLLSAAENRHDEVDGWHAPSGVKVVQIAGWGVPATVSGMQYTMEKDTLKSSPMFTVDGDGTVVTPSALWMDGAERYWVDMGKYNSLSSRAREGRLLKVDHSDLFEITEIDTFVEDIITHTSRPLNEYEYIVTQVPMSDGTRLQYSLHSPLSLNLTDDQGRHTGLDKDGRIEEQIPGTYYRQFGEVKYIFADETTPLHVSMEGYDEGVFTFEVEELRGDASVGKVTFKDVPTTKETKVFLDTTEKFTEISALRVDEDGDGAQDFHLYPKVGEEIVFDATAPITTYSIEGKAGSGGWYMSDAAVTLSPVDDESGIAETRYSLDDGETWTVYAEPFTITKEGLSKVRYFSVNMQGMKEETREVTVRIDTIAPEARIAFDPLMQKINIVGIDALSSVAVATKGGVVTLKDEAGHEIALVFGSNKEKDEKKQDVLILQSIAYGGVETDMSKTSIKYEFEINKKTQAYREFEAQIKSQSGGIQAKYQSRDDMTSIVRRIPSDEKGHNDEGDSETSVKERISGLVVPGVRTEKGKIVIYY
ncbi:MAG: hypothetical protein PHT88_01500 [Candidatus Moranbacteria bacterium]|nr:hypothetical protein [Candidatus Moranbacteria bacterium]